MGGECRLCGALIGGLSPLLSSFCNAAGLEEGVTDEALRSLSSAGCGKKLTSLSLEGECCCCVLVSHLVVCGSLSVGCMLL